MFLKEPPEPAEHFTAGAASPWVAPGAGGAAECWAPRAAPRAPPALLPVLGQPGPRSALL